MCLAAAAACSGPKAGRLQNDASALLGDVSVVIRDMAADPFAKQSGIEAGLVVRDLGSAAAGAATPVVDRLRSLLQPSTPEQTRTMREGRPGRLTIVVADPPPAGATGAFPARPAATPNAAGP